VNGGKIGHYQTQTINEILDDTVDQWVSEEKCRLEKEGIEASKLQLKTRLARSIGLGAGSDSDNAALKALYRFCSGETPLSIERALLIGQQTRDYRLIEWSAWQVGLLTTPRITNGGDLPDGEDIFLQIVELQKETSGFVALLSAAVQGKPSRNLINAIEDAHRKAALSMDKSARLLSGFVRQMLKTGAAGK
jgi:hypothetical protein